MFRWSYTGQGCLHLCFSLSLSACFLLSLWTTSPSRAKKMFPGSAWALARQQDAAGLGNIRHMAEATNQFKRWHQLSRKSESVPALVRNHQLKKWDIPLPVHSSTRSEPLPQRGKGPTTASHPVPWPSPTCAASREIEVRSNARSDSNYFLQETPTFAGRTLAFCKVSIQPSIYT
jgi:hypothetical protein